MGLHDAICKLLETKLLEQDESGAKATVIRSGQPLPESIDLNTKDPFPHIIPRLTKVENIKNNDVEGGVECIATLDIQLNIHAPLAYSSSVGEPINKKDAGGYRDFWNLVEAIRQLLHTQGTVNNQYRMLTEGFEVVIYPEDIEPFWQGVIQTKWQIGLPRIPKHKSFW